MKRKQPTTEKRKRAKHRPLPDDPHLLAQAMFAAADRKSVKTPEKQAVPG